MRIGIVFACVLATVLSSFGQAAAAGLKPPPPKSPSEALATLKVSPGFRIELVAAEPLVVDPVAIEWGADGKLWVAEMADYPLGLDGKMKAGSRIRYLEDTDGDGRYDKSTLFLENVNFANGVLPWRRGVLVTAAPEIFYAEDTDGDGRADVRRTLYKGFVEGNPQLRVNGLQWGLDGWVYCANGWSGGVVNSLKTGTTIDISGRDLRIRPDEGLVDTVAGVTEFGRNRDDQGNWFGCDNSNPLWQFVLEDYYTRRNPHAAPPEAKYQLMQPVNPKVYPLSQPQKRYHTFEQSGRFTSACGAMVYRDELLFGVGREQHAFVCEPVHNLVHHEVLEKRGVTFAAHRPREEKEREFLASTDLWFRPVTVRTGPDGALWVVDMYRYMIEHPEFLPAEGKAELGPYFRLGDDRGRIYRIYPEGKKPRKIVPLEGLAPEALAAAMDSPSGWQRDAVQQLCMWRGDRAVVAPLERQLAATSALVRMQALCTLDGMGRLSAEHLRTALADPNHVVRCQAVRIAEHSTEDAVVEAAMRLVDDPALGVRLQLASSLGAWKHAGVGPALARLATQAASQPYIAAAAYSSINQDNLEAAFAAARKDESPAGKAALAQLWRLAAAFGRDDLVMIVAADMPLAGGHDPRATFDAFAGVMEAIHRRKTKPTAPLDAERVHTALVHITSVLDRARAIATDSEADEAQRISAIRLAGYDEARRAEDIKLLGELLVPQNSKAVQAAAVSQLARFEEPAIAVPLLAGWASYGPSVRSQVFSAILTRPAWLAVLLDKLAAGEVLPTDIDATSRQQLIGHKDPELRKRAAQLLAGAVDEDRQKVINANREVVQMHGDVKRGATVFQRKCSACHKIGNAGYEVGPNLLSLTDKSAQNILISVLDPSRAVETRYRNYIAQTAQGQTFTGVLAAETGNSITLLAQEGKQQVILRADLDELQSTGKSLMPDGLEKDLSRQDLADLVTYVTRLKADGTASAN